MKLSLCVGVLLLCAASAWAQDGPRTARFYGYAFDLESNRYLYTELHEQRLDGQRWYGGTIRYFWPDGRQFGHKTLDFSADPGVPLYRMDQTDIGYSEGVVHIGAKEIELMRREPGENEERERVEREPLMAADSGFHGFIRMHLDELRAGQTISFRMAVPGRLDSVRFRLRKSGDTRMFGKPAVQLIGEPDSLLRLLIPPLRLTYSMERGGTLLEYRGPSNIRDPATGKTYNARIVYAPQPPPDAPKLPPLE